MNRFFRILGVIVIAYAGVMAVLYLQYLFDRGDLRKAEQVISQFKPKGEERTLMRIMADSLGVDAAGFSCESRILSRYEGRIEVGCGKIAAATKFKPAFRFEVDVVGATIRALDGDSKNLLGGTSQP